MADIPEGATEQIKVAVVGATDTNMTIDQAVDYIKEFAIPIIERQAQREIAQEIFAELGKAANKLSYGWLSSVDHILVRDRFFEKLGIFKAQALKSRFLGGGNA